MQNTILSFLVLGASRSAAPMSASTVTLTGTGKLGVIQQTANDSVYVQPYKLNVSGNLVAGLCVDFKSETKLSTIWNASREKSI